MSTLPQTAAAAVVGIASFLLVGCKRPIGPVKPTALTGNPMFKGATSVGRDGNWTESRKFLSGPRYVPAFAGSTQTGQKPLIQVYNEDRSPCVAGVEWVDCRLLVSAPLGTLHIMHIAPKWHGR